MLRRRKNKRSTAAKPRAPRFRINLSWIKPPDWQAVQRSSGALAWLVAGGVVITGWIVGVPRLHAAAAQRAVIDPAQVTVRFTNPPVWVKGALADSLLRTATMQISSDPLQRDDLVAIREALLHTGWIDAIHQVRRCETDLIEISAAFARPYTLIRDSAGHHLVDVAGKLLPKSYGDTDDLPAMYDARSGQTVPMIALTGVHFRRPAIGQFWEGTDVSAGLKLLHLLDRQVWRNQVAEIDVSSVLRDGPIRIRTHGGNVIVWGGPPGEEAALELLAEGKIQRLNLLYHNHGRIDGGRSGELDITGEKVAVAR